MVDLDNLLNNMANTVTNKINEINSSEKMKTLKKQAKETGTKLIDYGISLKGKMDEKISEVMKK